MTVCGELALEETANLSQDDASNECGSS